MTDNGSNASGDELAILRTMNRYSRALDYCLADEWHDVFTEDARYETVLPDGQIFCLLTTREELSRFLDEYPKPPVQYSKHVLVNPVIDIDGDEAQGDSGWMFFSRGPEGLAPHLKAFGRYLDRFRREGSLWRIAERRCLTEAVG
jgi:hypothetical protein